MITNYALREIIRGARGVPSYRPAGGLDWIDTERFDIVGRAPDSVPRDVAMLRRCWPSASG